ncbi:MAG TPA: DEAD/DEAH box helicase family protein [Vicinamibacterales bacterium]|nr:DEAD/DEAH box helicase family protein [Vicinamibacterales bacterium]
MPPVVIDNPILNSPFREPTRHFRFSEEGITDQAVDGRRESGYFLPIASPRKKGGQLKFETEWTEDRFQSSPRINRIRERVALWRRGGYVGCTRLTERLLRYWSDPERERKLFFCQIEALETAIYLTEVASHYGDAWIENELREENAGFNGGLPRLAFKMATGSGKTVVMAMLIAWQALNKLETRQDRRFSDAFLIVTPGITIRDRLRVLLPTDPDNYYRQRDILPADMLERLGQARIVITNYHAFLLHERGEAARLTKAILTKGETNPFVETPDQMVRRVCRELAGKKQLVVINDEAHHCYRPKPSDVQADVKLTGEERAEAKKREEEARVWMSGLEAVHRRVGLRGVYDLSATPFFLKGSGYPEGTLFPWVVSDFSLIDAIESGIVKVPRVPVEDNAMVGDQPTYRDLWHRIRDDLPKKVSKMWGPPSGGPGEGWSGEPKLPAALQGAIHSLYQNYAQSFHRWEANADARARGLTPPVFVVVCNNTSVSKLVFDYVAGWSKTLPDGTTVPVPGQLPLFSNVDGTRWSARPTSILVDSRQLESGDAMSDEFKRMAATEIEEFKAEYRVRFPGRDSADLTDEDLLREVMNTVGKNGKLGEQIRCVVSVSMLTEGWDANTVTHILGVRAFGTQLLCEQVVGRGLRRTSYAPDADGFFTPEYAEVYGVPFSFIPTSGSTAEPKPGPTPTRVRALEDRIACEITFPRLQGYRFELPTERLSARLTDASKYALSTADIPTITENAPIVGEKSIHTLDDLRARRPNEVAFLLAKLVLEKYFRQDGETRPDKKEPHAFDAEVQAWLYPQVLTIAKRWLTECLTLKNEPDTFPQLLLLLEFAHDAADRIYHSIVSAYEGEPTLKPILRPYDTVGSTRWVDFDTIKPVWPTRPDKCHVSHAVADTGSWEQKLAQVLEELDDVTAYVKNQGLNFTIPYTLNGDERQYYPDFLAKVGSDLTLVIEVSGEARKDKAAKVAAARTLWVPAVNNHGGFGRWAFVEVTDPWDAKGVIRLAIADSMTPA